MNYTHLTREPDGYRLPYNPDYPVVCMDGSAPNMHLPGEVMKPVNIFC